MKRHVSKHRNSVIALVLAFLIVSSAVVTLIAGSLFPALLDIHATPEPSESETEAEETLKDPSEETESYPDEHSSEGLTEVPSPEEPSPEEPSPEEPATEPGEDTTVGNPDEEYDPEYSVFIGSAEELMNFNKAVNQDGETFYDMTIVFTSDIDLSGYAWTPLNGYAFDYTTFDGNGHTISNMEMIYEVEQGTPADEMGAGFVGVARGDITFRDITFDNCKVTAYERAVGCLIGCVTNGYMTFENVNVKHFTVDGWMDYNNQDRENGGHPVSHRSAGFIGHIMAASSSAYFNNCHVDTIKLSGFHNLAGFIGYSGSMDIDEFCFTNCSVSNAEFTFSYCMSDSYTVDMPRKFVSVFYNSYNWSDNVDYVVGTGNTYTNVSYFDWSDDNTEYTAGEFRSWTREEADAAA